MKGKMFQMTLTLVLVLAFPALPGDVDLRQASHHDISLPLSELMRSLPPDARAAASLGSIAPAIGDPLVVQALQDSPGPSNPFQLVRSFDGLKTADSSFVVNCEDGTSTPARCPADATGAVGPHHYVQSVNFATAVYNKHGTRILGPQDSGVYWTGFGGACSTGDWSDEVVLYDRAANRWVVSRFARDLNTTSDWYQCFAISMSPDPTGSYYRYAFLISTTEFNDYPKIGIWPDAYYLTANRNKIFSNTGIFVAAFEREKMLAGQDARMILKTLDNSGHKAHMLPADRDGLTPPPAGAPNYLVRALDDDLGWPADALELWEFHVDWANPAASTLTLAQTISPDAFNSAPCGSSGDFQKCVPQKGTTNKLDPLAYGYLMYRLEYRNFGDHQALVLNQTVAAEDTPGHVAIRWYELRKSGGGAWSIYQQSTYAPDPNHRWVGSIATDRLGNLALGFSLSGPDLFPSIAYTGRLAGDPLGTLAQEATLQAGGGAQTGFIFWSDWSQLTVDPTDDCTFWYVNGYNPITSENQAWSTRIGAFRIPNCVVPVSIDIKPGSDPNSFNCTANGNLPVAILGSASFDATAVDVATVTLDATIDNTAALGRAGIQDVNGDGRLDIVVYFSDEAVAREIGCPLLKDTQIEVILRGRTTTGVPFVGSDVIRVSTTR